jgi:hypothetical protein
VTGLAFTFYVPSKGEHSELAWDTLEQRDPVIRRAIAIKRAYPDFVKSNAGALEMMLSDRAKEFTGEHGEPCLMRRMLPLYLGEGGNFERTFCCYGNNVDCTRCGAYAVFNAAYHAARGEREEL